MITLDVVTGSAAWAASPGGSEDPEGLTGWQTIAQRAADAAVAVAPGAPDETLEATLLLTDDAAIRALNLQWRGKDTATNVLSFPSAAPSPRGEPRHLGDIALAYETLVREAADEGKKAADHMTHLVVHGVLHLLGQDHLDDKQADAMEAVEVKALARLGIADPYRGADGA